MPAAYQHWDDEKTLARMLGDQQSVHDLAEAFMDEYPIRMKALLDERTDIQKLSDELHTLRSMLAIFNADAGHAMAVSMDRSIRAGTPVSPTEQAQLVHELRAFAAELNHYLSMQKAD